MAQMNMNAIGLLAFTLVGWVVSIGGIGSAFQDCTAADQRLSCEERFGWDLFVIFFELGVILAGFAAPFVINVEEVKSAFVGFFSMATVFLAISLNKVFLSAYLNDGINALRSNAKVCFFSQNVRR